ncbi:trans isomerase-like 3 [Seminavis robusta]|uniref:Peptidyl-prolyl cis-trans isomerase n=1 Tax=Seminavis robusta TaxID=568900 RepID=A0A9N8DBE4_9STRA|nr:trans isomerase-like 3 [Seminavis robusta]|eukprot:Sro71_g039520.1 trans isomerase-like 3 (258) ;mRNA; r:102713-103624
MLLFSTSCLVFVASVCIILAGEVVLAKSEYETEIALVTCGTTKGEFEMTFFRDWSPNGYDRAVELFKGGFYDHSHFFRVVPRFLCQFGISYTDNAALKSKGMKQIRDDPLQKSVHFEQGTISYAGSGPNSRTSHLFISFMKSGQFGSNPWETPIGKVTKGYDEVVAKFYAGYGDMPPWGKGPQQQPIYDGPHYIEDNFPKLDKFLTCKVETKVTKGSNVPPVSEPDIDEEDPYGFADTSDSRDEESDDSDDAGHDEL